MDELKKTAFITGGAKMTISESGRKIIERIPAERILIETDGPFTSLGKTAFNPTMVNHILKKLQGLNSFISEDSLYKNFHNLLS
jgi:TatD DNase family protein